MKIVLASGLALALSITVAAAQSGSSSSTTGTKSGTITMSQAECQSLWSKVDAKRTGSVTEDQTKAYVSSFKAVDTNGDGKLSSSEFLAACQKGMVHDTATSGSSTGSTGMDKNGSRSGGTGATGSGSAGTGSPR